jgi:hypothetical protein
MEKKEWKSPELVVLVRSKPEEAVLAACKAGPASGSGGPGAVDGGCSQAVPACTILV